MSEHPNLTRLRAIVAALHRWDLEPFVDAYGRDGVYRVPGDNLISGSYRGRDAIGAILDRQFELSGGTFRFVVHDTLADDDHAVLFWRVTAERDDCSLDSAGTMTMRIGPDGSFSESWFLYNDQRAFDAFYS